MRVVAALFDVPSLIEIILGHQAPSARLLTSASPLRVSRPILGAVQVVIFGLIAVRTAAVIK